MPVALGPTDPSACKLRQKTTETWLSRLTEPSRNASATVKYTYLQSNSKDSTKSQSNDAWIHRQAIYSADNAYCHLLSQYMGQRFSFFENVFSLRVCSFTVHNAYCSSSESFILQYGFTHTGHTTVGHRRLSKTKSMQQRGEQRPRR